LDEYVKVSNPGIWMLLSAIIILLIGGCVWAVFGHLDTNIGVAARCESGTLNCYVKESDFSKIKIKQKININGEEFIINHISQTPIMVDDSFSDYTLHVGNLKKGEWVYVATTDSELADGTYYATITVESVTPMSFVFN
ncbi:MAG: hypothetical protein K5917_01200, partial [Clostridiales bacterium]|nr:hypothetical protein [Clostridiales bacterium]